MQDNAGVADHRIMVIVLDDLQIRAPMTGRVKALVRRLIEGLGPDDRAAIVFTRNNRAAQDFTTDHARLLAAVEKFSGAFSAGSSLPSGRRDSFLAFSYRDSVRVLERISRSLADIPRRRKAIVYVSVGIPPDAVPAAYEQSGLRGDTLDLYRDAHQSGLRGDTLDLYRDAQRSSVSIYSIDPSYLGELDNENATSASPGDDTRAAAAHSHDFLRTLAENTGGLAIVERNDLEPGVRQVLQDTGCYYLLGYQPADATLETKRRRVTVKVSRPGVTVRTRAGYYPARTEKPAPGAPTSELDRALGGLLPKSDLRMRAVAAPFAAIGRPGTTVALVVALRQPPGTEGSRLKEQLDFAVSAYDTDGALKASKRDGLSITLRPGPAEVVYEALFELDLKPGRYQLRVAAKSAAQGKSGSVYCDLEVPDFSKAPLALSALVLSAVPAPPMTTPDRLVSLLPVVPTSLREFTSSSRVEAFARVYQNEKSPSPVALAVTVTNAEGGVVFDSTKSLAADQFQGRAAEYRIEVPISRLAPGPYLLSLEARGPNRTPARRSVPFGIER